MNSSSAASKMTKAHGRRPSKNRMRDHLSGWLFVLPLLVVFLVFIGIPVFRTVFYLGFTDYNLMKDPAWVGLSNYEKLFTSDPNAADMWGATFRIPLYLIPLHVGLSLLIAFLVHSCRLKAVQYATRTLIYFPVLATTASVAIAWNYMFNENRGVINWLLQQVGILGPDQNVRWLISTETAMWAIVIFSAWKFIGQHFLYYFVGLQNIPDTYYEAAKIDGANSLQMFWKVTLPLITPTIFFILMVSLTGTMQAFDEPFFVTNGGPGYYTTNAALYIYRKAFQAYDMGYASAVAAILFIIVFLLTLLQLWSQKKWVVYDYEERNSQHEKKKSRRQTGGFPGPYRFGLPADLPDLGSALFVDAGHQYEAGNRFLQPASGFLARAVEHRKLSEGF